MKSRSGDPPDVPFIFGDARMPSPSTWKRLVDSDSFWLMAFPVDMLDNCSHEELENSAEDYMLDLRCGDPENLECFPVSLSNVGFVPLYGGDQTQKVLSLFAPEGSLTGVALYQWWAIEL